MFSKNKSCFDVIREESKKLQTSMVDLKTLIQHKCETPKEEKIKVIIDNQ